MDEPLHPSNLSEILDRTAAIYRSRFLVFLGIAVIPTAVILVFAGAVFLTVMEIPSTTKGNDELAAMVIGILTLALLLVGLPTLLGATSLATAAMSQAASRAYLGQSITIRDSYKAIWRRGWRYVGLFVFQGLVIWVVPIVAWTILVVVSAGLAAIAQSVGMGSGGGLFALAAFLVVVGLVTYGFWMALRLSLAFPACVVEQASPWDALRRSTALSKGSRGRILLLYLLGAALNWILSIALLVPFTILLAVLPSANTPQHAQTAGIVTLFVIYGSGFAVQAFTRPVYGIALMLFYYDQRIRQEGFDIEWMMLKAGLIVPPPPQPGAQPWTTAVGMEAATNVEPVVGDDSSPGETMAEEPLIASEGSADLSGVNEEKE